MICPSCGGVVGLDCFNVAECAAISHDMAMRESQKLDRNTQTIQQLMQRLDEMEARVDRLESGE